MEKGFQKIRDDFTDFGIFFHPYSQKSIEKIIKVKWSEGIEKKKILKEIMIELVCGSGYIQIRDEEKFFAALKLDPRWQELSVASRKVFFEKVTFWMDADKENFVSNSIVVEREWEKWIKNNQSFIESFIPKEKWENYRLTKIFVSENSFEHLKPFAYDLIGRMLLEIKTNKKLDNLNQKIKKTLIQIIEKNG